jgi:hypothetical protein
MSEHEGYTASGLSIMIIILEDLNLRKRYHFLRHLPSRGVRYRVAIRTCHVSELDALGPSYLNIERSIPRKNALLANSKSGKSGCKSQFRNLIISEFSQSYFPLAGQLTKRRMALTARPILCLFLFPCFRVQSPRSNSTLNEPLSSLLFLVLNFPVKILLFPVCHSSVPPTQFCPSPPPLPGSYSEIPSPMELLVLR